MTKKRKRRTSLKKQLFWAEVLVQLLEQENKHLAQLCQEWKELAQRAATAGEKAVRYAKEFRALWEKAQQEPVPKETAR